MMRNEDRYLKYIWRDSAERLRKIGVKTPLLDARLLLQNVLDISYESLLTSATRSLTDDEIAEFETLMARRVKREPISKIIGIKEFFGLEFKVSTEVLDPRPDSETLIYTVLDRFADKNKDLKILDLGTGSGCLLLTLLKQYPNATGVGADKSSDALKIASENAENLGLSKRVEFVKSDWFKNIEGQFDIIISNPPYIKSDAIKYLDAEVRLYDPKLALDGGDEGLDEYHKITAKIADHLNTHGHAYYEIGKWQEKSVCEIIEENKFDVNEVKKDLLGIPRIIEFSRPYLKVVK